MTEIATTTLLIYGALLIVGGVLGYVLPEKPSKISLFAGGGTGLLAIAAYFLAEAPTMFVIGAVVASLGTGGVVVTLVDAPLP